MSDRAVPFPRGMADAAGGLACIENLAGAIEAVDLGLGRRQWRSAARGLPVLIAEGLVVVVQASARASGPSRAVLLDLSTGVQRGEVALPALAPKTGARDVTIEASFEGRTVHIAWRVRGGYAGGAPPPESVLRRHQAASGGAVRWNLDTGAVETDSTVPRPGPALPTLPTTARSTAAGEEDALGNTEPFAYRQRGAWREEPWRYDRGWAWLAVERVAGERRVVLVSVERNPEGAASEGRESTARQAISADETDPTATAPPRTVTLATSTAIEPLVTADGAHLLVRATQPPSTHWRLLDVRAGREIATVPYVEGTDQPAVLGARLYFLAPWNERWALHACAFPTGNTLWRYPLDPPGDERVPPLRQ